MKRQCKRLRILILSPIPRADRLDKVYGTLKSVFILFLTLPLLWISESAFACAERGICDLTGVDWDEGAVVRLDGQWALYWQQILHPDQIEQSENSKPLYESPITDWNTAANSNSPYGYATYHVKLYTDHSGPLTIVFPEISSAANIYVNARLIKSFGNVASNESDELPKRSVFYYTFEPNVGVNTLTLQISNFSYVFNSLSRPILVGRPDTIINLQNKIVLQDALVFGGIIIMVFYHFYLWSIRRTRISPLYYGLFCLVVATRSTVAGSGELFGLVFGPDSFEIQFKIEFLGFALGIAFSAALIKNLYPNEVNKWFFGISFLPPLFWAVLTLVTSARIYPRLLPLFQLQAVVCGIGMVIAVVMAVKHKRQGARLFLGGFLIFFLTAVNDLLEARNLIDSVPMAHFGVFGFVLIQSLILSLRFDRAFDRAEQAEFEVRQLNEGLELKVKERTEEISTILQNVKSGFLLIDRHAVIFPGFTESCHRLLGRSIKAGDSLTNILPLYPSERDHLALAIDQVFDDLLPIEVTLGQLPRRLEYEDSIVSLSASEVRNQETNQLRAILLTINDARPLKEAERKIARNEMLLNILERKEAFKQFLQDWNKEIGQCREAIKGDDARKIKYLLHTMKGNLASFGFSELVELIHRLEDRSSVSLEDIDLIEASFDGLLKEHKNVLRLEERRQTYSITDRELKQLISLFDEAPGLTKPMRQRLSQFVESFRLAGISKFIESLEKAVQETSKALDKSVSFKVTNSDLRVSENLFPLLRTLVHLLRNAIDHGIEPPSERGAKDPIGSVELRFEEGEQALQIIVIDDGTGLDLQRISEKALDMGLVTSRELQAMDDEAIALLIFADGFSTREEVTEVSGRGVGVAAVYHAVIELGGSLRLDNHPGQGLRVILSIPASQVMFRFMQDFKSTKVA